MLLPNVLRSIITNTFGFRFVYDLRLDERGEPLPPKRILPSTEQQALEVAAKFGSGGGGGGPAQ